jgi:hypothetical protein
MVWSLGEKEDGLIEALIPLELIRVKGETGSTNVAITWNDVLVLGVVGA